jgi:glyoxylase-like metal-dependent hydrolase (beta-lactamase superfamily II)
MIKLPQEVSFWERGWLSSNNILLRDASQAILVDTGYWTHAEQTLALVQAALGSRPLTGIINTHLHSDHCGGNARLQSIYPYATTHIPPGHADYVFDWDPAALTYTPTGQHCPQFTATDVLCDGDHFEVGSTRWTAHAAPGHDPNSMVLFCESARVLISADALWGNGFGVVFPEIEGISAFDEVAATLDLIESLQPSIVLPGHGSAFTDVPEAIERARKRLAGFRNDPVKHAMYAAKVLLKFKLLELQRISVQEFLIWSSQSAYMQELRTRYAHHQSFEAWFEELCLGLQSSGAAILDDGYISNT